MDLSCSSITWLIPPRYIYMGEYPHCFAACLGQVDSFRLLMSKKVDPNVTDFNGNNVLHIMVIKDKMVSTDGGSQPNEQRGFDKTRCVTGLILVFKSTTRSM